MGVPLRDDEGFSYDVFVSYRWVSPDQEWVRHELVPALMRAGLKVCLDVMDFIPGRDLILEMERAGIESRQAICVISPAYFDGNRMVGFESQMLRRLDPSGQTSHLIPLIVRNTKIPERIRGLVPIDWTNPATHALEWMKLLKALNAQNLDAPVPGPIGQAPVSKHDPSRQSAPEIVLNSGAPPAHASSPAEDVVFQQFSTPTSQDSSSTKRGWRKTNDTGIKISISRMPITGRELFGRERELAMLDDSWVEANTYIVCLIAWGGVGKSALMQHWLRSMGEDQYRGARRVYAWSFYRQGTTERVVSADEFIASALAWFDDPDPTQGTAWDKGERLAKLIRASRTLLLLDGLEPLQHPPGRQGGLLKDPSLQALLRELASANPGLCVISTRLPISDLEDFEGSTVKCIELEHLSPSAGAELLRSQGVKGSDVELEEASEEFEGHSLALTLLGSYLREAYKGDVKYRDKINPLKQESKHSDHAKRVMASYEKWFGEGPELDVLRLISFFDRPAEERALLALRTSPLIPGLTDHLQTLNQADWQTVLSRLRRARLIAEAADDDVEMLDAHPLVREYFRQQVSLERPEAWRQGNHRLYKYFKNVAKEYPDTIQEMEPLFLSVVYGCQAAHYRDALYEVFLPRILRGESQSYAGRQLGARGAILSALAYFFEDGDWSKPIAERDDGQGLEPLDQLIVLTQAGLNLTATLGYSFDGATRCYTRVRELSIELGKANALYSALTSQWRNSLVTDKMSTTLRIAEDVHKLAEEIDNPALLMGAYRSLTDTLHFVGDFTRSKEYSEKGIRLWESDKDKIISLTPTDEVMYPILTCYCFDSLTLWHLGYPDQAQEQMHRAIKTSQDLSDVYGQVVALYFDCFITQFRREPQKTLESARKSVLFSRLQQFSLWLAGGYVSQGWAEAMSGNHARGIALLQRGIQEWRNTKAVLIVPYWLAMLAEAYGCLKNYKEALIQLKAAHTQADSLGEYWWLSEICRLKGVFLRQDGASVSECVHHYEEALQVAQQQGSKSMQLRILTSWCKTLGKKGRQPKLVDQLGELYSSFAEGLLTADLKDARKILEGGAKPPETQ
jgi:tetratricopeptide (TPR) repeat protein